MSVSCSDKNLLFGSLAAQMGFCSGQQLVAAMLEWMQEPAQALGDILLRHGALDETQKRSLDQRVAERVAEPPAKPAGAGIEDQSTEDIPKGAGRPVLDLSETLPRVVGTDRSTPSGGMGEGADAASGGRFQVLSFHAEGGLGRVMVAEDRELGRHVALKEIKPDQADNPVARERFVLEAEITGGLEHPGIVPVYGLGKYSDGRPYYAMRFIRGNNLAEAVKAFHDQPAEQRDAGEREIELRRLLRRFTDVCHAVHYAHSRGVLHRDLKPGNVMLGKYGETLLVDWGVAKLIGRTEVESPTDEVTLRVSSGSGSHATMMGSAVGTLPYMSPEQAAGKLDELGVASDVYSLGATLYCLLTGQSPFPGKRVERERVIAGQFPPPRSVQPQVPPALEAICLKAMARAAADRYAAADQIVADVERWLADEPVSVYRETRSERAARWMRRHRAWVQAGVASLLVIAVISAAAAAIVFRAWQREAVAWSEAGRNFVQAREAVDRWLSGVGEALAFYPVANRTRVALLEQAAEEYERFVRQRSDDLEIELERGRTYLRLGHLRRELGDRKRAAEAYRQAAGLFDQLRRHGDSLDCRLEQANCQTDLGVVAWETEQLKEAAQCFDHALGQLRELAKRYPGEPAVSEALAAALLNQGELLAEQGQRPAAEGVLREALETLAALRTTSRAVPEQAAATQAAASQPDAPQIRHRLKQTADVHDLLGRVLLDQGRYDDALAEIERSIRLAGQLADQQPDNPRHWKWRADAQIYLASVLRELGRVDDEAEAYQQASETYRTLCTVLPGVTDFESSLALTLLDHGGLLYQLGRVQEAEKQLTEARAAAERLKQLHPDTSEYRDTWALSTDTLAELLRDRGEFEKAEAMFGEAIRTYEELLPSVSNKSAEARVKYAESLALCRSHLAQSLQLRGQHAEADQAYAAAIEGLMKLGADSPRVLDELAEVHQHRGVLCQEWQKPEEALTQFRRALELGRQLASASAASPEHRAHLAWLLADCPHSELRDAKEAVRIASTLVAEVPGNAEYRNILGAGLYRSGDYAGAVKTLQQADRLRAGEHARDGLLLAMAYGKGGQPEAAKEAYRQAVRWLERNLPRQAELRRLQRDAAEVLGLPPVE
jgi:serine/threonine-protein kinase